MKKEHQNRSQKDENLIRNLNESFKKLKNTLNTFISQISIKNGNKNIKNRFSRNPKKAWKKSNNKTSKKKKYIIYKI